MTAILSLLLVVTLSIVVTRVAAVALRHTGLARQTARFQARSAFSGAGFTTNESDSWMEDRPLSELRPADEGVLVLGMLTSGGEWIGTPAGDTRPAGGDTLVVYGRTQAIRELTERRAGDEDAHRQAVADQDRIATRERRHSHQATAAEH